MKGESDVKASEALSYLLLLLTFLPPYEVGDALKLALPLLTFLFALAAQRMTVGAMLLPGMSALLLTVGLRLPEDTAGPATPGANWVLGLTLVVWGLASWAFGRATDRPLLSLAPYLPVLLLVVSAMFFGEGWFLVVPLLLFLGSRAWVRSPHTDRLESLREGLHTLLLGGLLLVAAAWGPWPFLVACLLVAALHGYRHRSRAELEQMFTRQMASTERVVKSSKQRFQAREARYQSQLDRQQLLDQFQGRALNVSQVEPFGELVLDAIKRWEPASGAALIRRRQEGEETVVGRMGAFRLEAFRPLPSHEAGQRFFWSPDGRRLCYSLNPEYLVLCQLAQEREEKGERFLLHLLARASLLLRILLQNQELASLLAEKSEALEQLERSQAQLVRSEKLAAIGQLAAGVAHELNSPLAAIQLQSELIVRRLKKGDSEGVERSLATMEEANLRARTIIADLLDYSRLPEGRKASLSLREELERLEQFLAPHLEQAGIVWKFRIQAEPVLEADAQELHQILTNLVLNARDALEQGEGERRLLLELLRSEDGPEIRVSNNGPPIPESDVSRLFDPFFTTKAPGSGTGLGLFISSQLAERNGAVLALEQSSGWVRFRLVFKEN